MENKDCLKEKSDGNQILVKRERLRKAQITSERIAVENKDYFGKNGYGRTHRKFKR